MRADPADQRRLLDLQQHDTALTQLKHRRSHLPEIEQQAEADAEIAAAEDAAAAGEAETSDLDRDIARLETEIDQVRQRAQNDRRRQDSAGVSPKELEGLGREIEALAKRQSELEERELELLERRESAAETAAGHRRRVDEKRALRQDIESRRSAAETEIDAEVESQAARRAEIAAALTDDLVHLYEKIRMHNPVAVALLTRRTCGSCRIEASGGELAALRDAAPDDVIRCENCRAVLVRTEESGL